jgi:hypothetical protein
MKKLFTFAITAAMLGALAVSCKPDPDPEPEPEPIPEGAAAFTSFGFYAEDNAGVLEEDYIVETIGDRMELRLPKEVDKSALVARFETLDNNEVRVGDKVQESGVTANNFTAIVDYEVSEPGTKAFKEYEVRLRNILGMALTHLGTYTTTDHVIGTDLAAAYSEKDDSYYIFYSSQEETSVYESPNANMAKGYVVKWDGTSFSEVGSGAVTEAGAASFDIKVDANGIPYVLYTNDYVMLADNTDEDDAINGFASMRKFDGSWTAVGGYLINSVSKPQTSYPVSFGFDPASGNPITAWHNNSNNTPVARRNLNMSFYNGAGWDTNILPSGAEGRILRMNFATDDANLYFEGYLQDIKKYVILKYTGGTSFETVATIDCSVEGTEFFQSGGTIIKQSFAISPDNNMYLTVTATPEGTDWKHNIYRYNETTKQFTQFGGELGFTPGDRALTPISFDNNNNPIVVSREGDMSGPVNLRVIDPATQQWSAPVAVGAKEARNLAIASDGKGGTFMAFPTALPEVVIGQDSDGDNVTVTPYEIDIWSFAMELDEE